MRLPRIFSCLLFLLLVSSIAEGQEQINRTSRDLVTKAPPTVPDSPQEVSLLFSGATVQERMLLTLNNNRPSTLKIEATVYDSSGQATQISIPDLQPSESRVVELAPILLKAGIGFRPLGYLKLAYKGIFLGLGAQLTLYPDPQGPGIDSPRSLAADYKTLDRNAVFWLPDDGYARVALTNTSSSAILVNLDCGPYKERLSVGPSETAIKLFLPELASLSNKPVSCGIHSTGSVSDLRVNGIVSTLNRYAAPIRFYDLATSTSPHLTAVGIDTDAETIVVVGNASSSPAKIRAVLREVGKRNPTLFKGDQITLTANSAARLATEQIIKEAKKAGVSRATITIETEANIGTLVGSVTQTNTQDRITEDIPLKSGNPAAFARGIYPLRWSEDYTNRVMVANSASQEHTVSGFVTTSAGIYILPKVALAPGETTFYDVDAMRKHQTADASGHRIPLTDTSAKIFWRDEDGGRNVGLIGRNSVSSIINHRRSSFSCGGGCSGEYSRFPHIPTFFPLMMPGDLFASPYQIEYQSPYGYYFDMPLTYSQFANSSNTDVFDVGGDPSNSHNFLLTANGGGGAYLQYYLYTTDGVYYPAEQYCDPYQATSYEQKPVTVQTPTSATVIDQHLQTFNNSSADVCGDPSSPVSNAYGYARCIIYQVKDQNGQDISKTLQIGETVTTVSSNYNFMPNTGGQTSNSAGQFLDGLAVINSGGALPSNFCAYVKQTITANSVTIRVNCRHYTATDATETEITSTPNACTGTC